MLNGKARPAATAELLRRTYRTRRNISRILAASTAAVVAVAGLAACGAGGTVYAVGDCLKTSVNTDGAAEKTDCSDPKSFKVTMLAKNGGRPNCPYYMGQDYASGGAAYLRDALTDVTYCGQHNGAY